VLQIHAANMYGKKGTRQARLNWAKDRMEEILDAANYPVSHQNWWNNKVVDKPYCLLRVCFEIRDAVTYGPSHITHLPVEVDACNSAYQHLAAATCDGRLAGLCNLTHKESEKDVYEVMGDKLCEKHNPGLTSKLLRKLVKTVAVPRAYGSGNYAITDAVAELSWENDISVFTQHLARKELKGLVEKGLMSEKYYDDEAKRRWNKFRKICVNTIHAVEAIVPQIKKIEDWMKAAAIPAMDEGQNRFVWTTPSGFKVVLRPQQYDQNNTVEMEPKGKKRIQIKYRIYKDEIHRADAKRALLVSLIHSYDAALLHLVVCGFKSNESQPRNSTGRLFRACKPTSRAIVTAHDAFAVHAPYASSIAVLVSGNMQRMYDQHNPLKLFAKEVIEKDTPAVPTLKEIYGSEDVEYMPPGDIAYTFVPVS